MGHRDPGISLCLSLPFSISISLWPTIISFFHVTVYLLSVFGVFGKYLLSFLSILISPTLLYLFSLLLLSPNFTFHFSEITLLFVLISQLSIPSNYFHIGQSWHLTIFAQWQCSVQHRNYHTVSVVRLWWMGM